MKTNDLPDPSKLIPCLSLSFLLSPPQIITPKFDFFAASMKTLATPITRGQNPFQIREPHVDDAMDPLSKPLETAQEDKSRLSSGLSRSKPLESPISSDLSRSKPLESPISSDLSDSPISSDLKRKFVPEPVESSKKYKSTISAKPLQVAIKDEMTTSDLEHKSISEPVESSEGDNTILSDDESEDGFIYDEVAEDELLDDAYYELHMGRSALDLMIHEENEMRKRYRVVLRDEFAESGSYYLDSESPPKDENDDKTLPQPGFLPTNRKPLRQYFEESRKYWEAKMNSNA